MTGATSSGIFKLTSTALSTMGTSNLGKSIFIRKKISSIRPPTPRVIIVARVFFLVSKESDI